MLAPCTFIVFGATGNLARIKLLPAIYHLEEVGRIPDGSAIVGFSRRKFSNDEWREHVASTLKDKARGGLKNEVFERLSKRLHMVSGEMTDADSLQNLKTYIDANNLPKNLIFYMAIPPTQYTKVSQAIADTGLHQEEQGWRRLVIEKPFGYDSESAQVLNAKLHEHFTEKQIFRIDHYLGKAMVQNVLIFRFANLMLEPLWNRNYIDHVQITHSESLGISGRAAF